MASEIETAKVQSTELAPAAGLTPMQMAYELISKGTDLNAIDRMLDMAGRLAAEESQRAFSVAFAAFKSEAITILRTREVLDGPLKGRRYAELYSFVNAATPALSKHGLSASWSVTKDEKDWIEVTCTLEHSLGGRRSVLQGGPPDSGGAKNPLQARISTVTYLERATFKAVCGLAEQGDDTDGTAPQATTLMSEKQVMDLRELIDATADPGLEKETTTAFLKWAKYPSIAEIPAAMYDRCVQAIKASKK